MTSIQSTRNAGVLLAAVALAVTASPSTANAGHPSDGDSKFSARTVDLDYRFLVREIPPSARSVVAWVPVPATNADQQLVGYEAAGGYPYTLHTEAEYGNRFLRFDLSGAVRRGADEADVSIRFRVKRRPVEAPAENATGTRDADPQLARFLLPDRLVPIDGEIATEARRVAGDAGDPLIRARRVYDHIVSTVSYDKTGEGWGRGDAVYACDVRQGNCTDFHSLFIGEARALGIPARFVMGLPLPAGATAGTIPGYHCWAEFYAADTGWLPLDASEASRNPDKHDALFGSLDSDRIAFSIGRDIRLPHAAAGPVNYAIYPHVEVDGAAHSPIDTTFSFRDVPQTVESAGIASGFFQTR